MTVLSNNEQMEPSKEDKSEVPQNQPNRINHKRKIDKDTRYIIVSPTPLIGNPEKKSRTDFYDPPKEAAQLPPKSAQLPPKSAQLPPESLPGADNHISFTDLMTTVMKGIWIRKHSHGPPETRCSYCHRNGLVTYVNHTNTILCLPCTDKILVACSKIHWVPPNTTQRRQMWPLK
jgi:hypothetical protein